MRKYRIVRDNYNGYEVQVKVFGMWWQCSSTGIWGTNTHSSVELAERFAKNHAAGGKVVKYLNVEE